MKINMADTNHAGHSRPKIGESASSNIHYDMSERTGKRRNRYVDKLKGKYKPTFLIHRPVNSSEECRIRIDFGPKYANNRPTKDRGKDQVKK